MNADRLMKILATIGILSMGGFGVSLICGALTVAAVLLAAWAITFVAMTLVFTWSS